MRPPFSRKTIITMKTTSKIAAAFRDTTSSAHQFEDAVYQLAQVAMTETNPHLVAFIMKEHDKINVMVKRMHSLIDNLAYTSINEPYHD